MKIQISILFILLLLGCKHEKVNNKEKSLGKTIKFEATEIKQKQANKESKRIQNKILGIWTDGSTENATFEIKPKSIYYVDDFKDYNYELNNDTIQINYLDYIYRAKIELKNDTLIMNAKDYNKAKYWRFKD